MVIFKFPIDDLIIVMVLAIIIFLALDPVNRLATIRNEQRSSDINKILTAIYEYKEDNNGVLPSGLSTSMSVTQIGTAVSGCNTSCSIVGSSACVNLNSALVKYLKVMPVDPDDGTQAETGYYITVNNNNIVSVGSCNPENGVTVEVSR